MSTHRQLGKMVLPVLGALFTRPATIRYPFELFRMPASFRGRPLFDTGKCTGCRLCVRDCPAQAITITRMEERHFEAALDLGRCVYCGQCAETCPRAVIRLTPEFELAQLDRAKLKLVFRDGSGLAS